ncbi:MAG: hypothetical protein ABIC04_07340 [Nanoarchaeota archaeon]
MKINMGTIEELEENTVVAGYKILSKNLLVCLDMSIRIPNITLLASDNAYVRATHTYASGQGTNPGIGIALKITDYGHIPKETPLLDLITGIPGIEDIALLPLGDNRVLEATTLGRVIDNEMLYRVELGLRNVVVVPFAQTFYERNDIGRKNNLFA